MEIKEIKNNKKDYIELLLEADPDEEVVKKYIEEGKMFVGFENNEAVCEVIVTEVNNEECELKNIAILYKARGKGYARKLIQYIFKEYAKKYKRMIVGTTENMIPFYILNGFTKYHHTVKNFFIDNYSEKIYDRNLLCIDMYYYSKELNNNINYSIVEIKEEYRQKVNEILKEEWESTDIIICGKIVDGTKLEGYIALNDRKIVGLITYMIKDNECEIVSLNSFMEKNGMATNLIEKVKEKAILEKCARLKLVTTNDNVKAIKFYQRKGFYFANKEMSVETMEKYGIKLHSIYEDLEKVVVHNGKRKVPLCKQVYGFNGDLTDSDEMIR